MVQNPLKPNKYVGPDQFSAISANYPTARYVDPASLDTKNQYTGAFWPVNSLWMNQDDEIPWIFSGASWIQLAPAGGLANAIIGPGVAVTDNALVRFDGTSGTSAQGSGTTLSDTNVMTFPAGGGPVLTASGAAARKGTVTLVGGASGDIATTSAITGAAISLTITALGTVTAPKPMLVTITNGVKFTITSSDATDTSTITWAIVG